MSGNPAESFIVRERVNGSKSDEVNGVDYATATGTNMGRSRIASGSNVSPDPIQPSIQSKGPIEPVAQGAPQKKKRRKLRKIDPNRKPKKPIDKYIWLAGHFATLFFSLVYFGYYFTFSSRRSIIAKISYKIVLLGIIFAYSVSMKSTFGKVPPGYFTLLSTDNFQYLLLSFVWLFNRNSAFKILPYFIISILQISDHFKIDAILKYEFEFKLIIEYNELFLFVLLTFDTLLCRGTSGYALVMFAAFFSLKIMFNDNIRQFIYSFVVRLDGVMSKQKNEKILTLWTDIKNFLDKKKAYNETFAFKAKA